MLYVLICKDLPGEGLARRLKARPNHLAYLESLGEKVRVAGGLLSEDGKEPRGQGRLFARWKSIRGDRRWGRCPSDKAVGIGRPTVRSIIA